MSHTFRRGDHVIVFGWGAGRKHFIEGRAEIVSRIDGSDNVYVVRFDKPVGLAATYERYVDPRGQDDPAAWVETLNRTTPEALAS